MKFSSIKSTGLALLLGAATVFSQGAFAADMLDDGTQGETFVEFGTGWYIRGDIGGGLSSVEVTTNFTNENADLGTPVSVSVAAGYDGGNGFRYEAALNQFTNLDFGSRTSYPDCGEEDHDGLNSTAPLAVSGECYRTNTANITASSIMANAYVQMNSYGGFTPYLGVGVGVAYVSWNEFEWHDICTGTQDTDCGSAGGVGVNERAMGEYEEAQGFSLSGNLMVGASYALTQNTLLDFGYRFTYIGETFAAKLSDNEFNENDLEVGSTNLHEFRVGLRYMIW